MAKDWEEIKKNIINDTDVKNESHGDDKISSLQDVWETANEKDKDILADIINEEKQ